MLFAENCNTKSHRQIQAHLESARWSPVRDRGERNVQIPTSQAGHGQRCSAHQKVPHTRKRSPRP